MEGYTRKEYPFAVKRYCQMLDLKDDPELIEEYRRVHSFGVQDKAIREEIRSVGILEMELYIKDNHLFMIVETPEDFDWDSAMTKLAGLPHQEPWEKLVSKFQKCDPGSTSAQKWTMMERMFYLYD